MYDCYACFAVKVKLKHAPRIGHESIEGGGRVPRWGWVVNAAPWSLYHWDRDPVLTVQDPVTVEY